MKAGSKHIGLLGGTFDPIHCGHLLAAEQAREQAGLDEIWFMPTHIPPHKSRDGLTPAEDRLAMAQLAVQDHPDFHVSDEEMQREGPSYTYDTMVRLVQKYAEYRFSFIIGADMVNTLSSWYRFEELVHLTDFIGLARPGFDLDPVHADHVTLVEMPVWDISSTLIRQKAAEGKSLRYLVPDAVERYIKEKRLYG
jgi:nicotinate-nucleotide adenylyltransferase